jgi:two-component system CheB/CheR fusion protein
MTIPRWLRRAAEPLAPALVATTILWIARDSNRLATGTAKVPLALALLLTWAAAFVVTALSRRGEHSPADVERISRTMAQSLKDLDEMRYALDQAAIVAVTDHRGVITYVNDKFCTISKYARSELLGQDHRIINSGYHSKELIRDLWRTIAHGRVWRGELRNRAKDGTFYWVDTTIVPFLDGRGKPRQYLAIRSDITQRKAAEAKLHEQAALTHLGQIAAVVAHEVRNPLAGLRGSLQMIDRRFAPGAGEHEVITAMIQRIDELNAKVNDLLQYAKPSPPRLQAVDVQTVLADVVASARAPTASGQAEIRVLGDAILARADPSMLRSALLNLVLNACQAAGRSGVDVEVRADGERCRIAVKDRGPGISPEIRARLFEPFATTRREGTGLGLPIVRRLIELQGGEVTVTDRPGGGTIAEVVLPVVRS